MRRYLCSEWALGREQTRWVKSMGFSGLRYDIPWGAPSKYIQMSFDQMSLQQLDALIIIGGWMRWGGDNPVAARGFAPPVDAIGLEAKHAARILLRSKMPVDFVSWEIGNEPDLSEWKSPREFAEFVRRGAEGIWEVIPTATVVVGGVSNVNRNGGAKYLDAICSAGVDARMILGVHPYRSDRAPDEAPKGWKSVDDVFRWLKSKERLIWVTECGWHTSPQKRRSGPFGIWSKNVQWSDYDVAKFVRLEMSLWENAGAGLYAYYQINDGENKLDPEQNFGVRYFDLTPKPVAGAFV